MEWVHPSRYKLPRTTYAACDLQSGIEIPDVILAAYEAVKLKHANKYVVFMLERVADVAGKPTYGFKIVKQADPEPDTSKNEAAFSQLVSELPSDDHRFVVFDFTDKKADGREIAKLVLIKWCPDSVTFKIKPIIGATYQRLKDKLSGLGKDIQAVDASDLVYAKIRAEL